MILKKPIFIFIILCTACSDKPKKPKDTINVVEKETSNYQASTYNQLVEIFKDPCSAKACEFEDLYPYEDTIRADNNEGLVLVDELKKHGFKKIDWGRGNWQGGPRIISLTMSNGQCDCVIDKLYYSTELEEKYKITERIKCEAREN